MHKELIATAVFNPREDRFEELCYHRSFIRTNSDAKRALQTVFHQQVEVLKQYILPMDALIMQDDVVYRISHSNPKAIRITGELAKRMRREIKKNWPAFADTESKELETI